RTEAAGESAEGMESGEGALYDPDAAASNDAVMQQQTGAASDDPDAAADRAVRIVDYKTGADSLDLDQLRSGYKLQLMIYMAAAMQQDGSAEPAGVFYFKIKDLDTDADVKNVKEGMEAAEERLEEAYKLEGIVLNDERLIEAMDGEFEDESQVIPVKQDKKGGYKASAGGHLLSREEFRELYDQVKQQVKRICGEISSGSIDISPAREKHKDMDGGFRNSCKFCDYRSICMFDTAFAGCRFRRV
ncbi:MAG: PD-(D/E)XK nuclease family protein, partial [Bacillota bacterium]|nr:PD-(D/E)XK nuclease family protein [Bacillota bacterium]